LLAEQGLAFWIEAGEHRLLFDTGRGEALARNSLRLEIPGIVENMSGFVCPKCGERTDLFKRGGGMALAQEMDVPFLGRIPIDRDVVTAGDAGLTLVHDGPQSPASRAFADIVETILSGDAIQRH
jgi:hypothetical protein